MTFHECINIFIQMEKVAAENYEAIAKLSKDENIVKVALGLVEEEKKHVVLLENIDKDTSIGYIVLNDEILEDISRKLSRQVQTNSESITTEKEFFITALQDERESIKLYDKFKNLFKENSEGYKLFESLIGEEKKHTYVILNRLHELE